MNYKAFYRTYRPTNFEQVVGQEHIVRTLINIIKMGKISHGYLFSGPRGTGKTSIAKIFANAINCIHAEKPENICNECLNVSNNSLDIIEIDAASNNSVNDIRIIKEQVNFAPTKKPYKIYIIDEVHMLSKSAFNALLMTLEEPPKHAIFILVTTNPDSIPDTILSRVQRHNFKKISKIDLVKQLDSIFKKENINFDTQSINLIATLANGSLRDALSIADQINSYSNSNISQKDIFDIFGLITIENQINLINFLSNKDISNALNFFDELVTNGNDISKIVSSLIQLLKDYLIYKKTKNINLVESTSEENLLQISMKSDCVYKVLDILIPLYQDLKYSDIPQQLCQLAIIKICSIEGELKDIDWSINNNIEKNAPLQKEEITTNEPLKTDNFSVEENNKKTKTTTILNEFSNEKLANIFNIDNFINENEKNIGDKDIEKNTLVEMQASNGLVNHQNNDDITSFVDTNIENKPQINEQNDSITIKNFQNNVEPKMGPNIIETETFIFENKFVEADDVINQTIVLLNESNEKAGSNTDLDETILDSTGEIDTINKTLFNTGEIDLKKPIIEKDFLQTATTTREFNLDESKEQKIIESNKINYELTQPNIINLFLLANKNTFDSAKEKLIEAQLSNDERFSVLFKELKFICSSHDYLLVSSNDDWPIDDINTIHKNDANFRRFLDKHFGDEVHFFAITKNEYDNSKKLFMQLKETKNVPRMESLPKINTNDFVEKNSDFDSKTKQIFGNIFKKKDMS